MSGKSIDESGVRVSQTTMNQIEPGVTTESWLIATLGEPTERTVIESELPTHILRYDHVVTRKSGGTVLFIFAGGSEERAVNRAYFETINGVVTRQWTDS